VNRLRSSLMLGALFTVLATATGCSIGTDQEPRDIDPAAVTETVAPGSSSGAEATGSGRIYLLAPETPETPRRLEPVARDVADNPTAVLQALLAGPNSSEFIDQLRTAIPTDLELNSARLRSGGILEVDVTEPLQELSSDLLLNAVAQIVYTSSTVTGVRSVLITVEGVTEQWPAGNGELQVEPLTVYDFPGFEPSSQPAYPGVPPPQEAG
jgi:spore germination protein GerM